jgi:hypothetical protein
LHSLQLSSLSPNLLILAYLKFDESDMKRDLIPQKHRSDATAGFSVEAQKIATDTIWPMFANEVVPTEKWIESLGLK